MPLKIHVIIIMCIVIVVSLAWEITQRVKENSATAGSTDTSHRIAVTHASLGLNCLGTAINNSSIPKSTDTQNKIREDNVFSAVSLMCNGSKECTVSASDSRLGEDPAPDCNPKTIEIEYRCFSYDRPWTVRSNGGSVKLQCTNQGGK